MRFYVYKDAAKQWRWRAVQSNGRILADSGEGYARSTNARRAIHSLIAAIHNGGEIVTNLPKRRGRKAC